MKLAYSAVAALALLTASSTMALAGTDAYIGEITTVAFNYCPTGTIPANGQILPISANQALFSLLGATYGGDGRTNFAVPSIAPVKTLQGPPLTSCIVVQGYFPDHRLKAAKQAAPKE
jgi:microcystin-dependent protein